MSGAAHRTRIRVQSAGEQKNNVFLLVIMQSSKRKRKVKGGGGWDYRYGMFVVSKAIAASVWAKRRGARGGATHRAIKGGRRDGCGLTDAMGVGVNVCGKKNKKKTRDNSTENGGRVSARLFLVRACMDVT